MRDAGKLSRSCYGQAMQSRSALLLPIILTLGLSACTGDQGEFPSLARRPAERLNTPAPLPQLAPTPAEPDKALLERIAALKTQATTAHERFAARSGSARGLVAAAAGAPVASEAWSVATIALSELEAARSEAMVALADLDALYARAVVDGTASDALAASREAVVALVAEEDQVLADLNGRLAN